LITEPFVTHDGNLSYPAADAVLDAVPRLGPLVLLRRLDRGSSKCAPETEGARTRKVEHPPNLFSIREEVFRFCGKYRRTDGRKSMAARFTISEADAPRELERLRDAIDHVDEVLVSLLNQRAKYAVEIGAIKGVLGLPIYSPEREKAVLAGVERHANGPLAPIAVRRLFERIIDESRRVEREASSEE
jgi:chorismate mutase